MEDFTYQPSNLNVLFIGDGLMERSVQYSILFLDDMIVEGNQTFTVSVVDTMESIEFTIIDTTGEIIIIDTTVIVDYSLALMKSNSNNNL